MKRYTEGCVGNKRAGGEGALGRKQPPFPKLFFLAKNNTKLQECQSSMKREFYVHVRDVLQRSIAIFDVNIELRQN